MSLTVGPSWSESSSQTASFLRGAAGTVSNVSSVPSAGPGTRYTRVVEHPSFPGLSQSHILGEPSVLGEWGQLVGHPIPCSP